MSKHRVALGLACALSLAIFTGGVARAEDNPHPALCGIGAKIRCAIGNAVQAVDTQITGRLAFRKWVKEDQRVREVYAGEKDARSVSSYEFSAALLGAGTACGASLAAISGGNLGVAAATVGLSALTGQRLMWGERARNHARVATVQRMLSEPGVTVPEGVLKLYKPDRER